jgi:hypothetical protein
MLALASCAADPTDEGDRDQVVTARILPAPLPDLLIGETVQLRLETRTRGGEQLQTTTAEWSLTEGTGTITATGVLTAARSGTVAGSQSGVRAQASFTVLPFPEFHPLKGTWRVTRWIRSPVSGEFPGFDLLGSGYRDLTLTLAVVDAGLVYGTVRVDGTDGAGMVQRASGTVIASHPDRLRLLLLPDGNSRFPMVLEEAWFRWDRQGGEVRLSQVDETLSWRFPSGLVRNAQDLIDLAR